MHVHKMAQAMDKHRFKGRNVSVPLLSSDDANANTKDNDGSKCCGKCNKIVKGE